MKKDCCRECFEPSRDVLRGPGYMIADAVPESCRDEECECHQEPPPKCKCGRRVASPYSENVCSNFPHCEAAPQQISPIGWEKEFDERFRMKDAALEGRGISHGLDAEIKAFIRNTLSQMLEEVEKKERLRAFEILYEHFLHIGPEWTPKDFMDCIEATQAEILANYQPRK